MLKTWGEDTTMALLNRLMFGCLLAAFLSAMTANASPITGYTQTNLVSDLGIAAVQDPNLQNPWGAARLDATSIAIG